MPEQTVPATWTGILESPPGAEATIDGQRYLYFAGTGYFALQGHPDVLQAGCEALLKYGVHSATSRGGYGNNPPLLEVERLAAEFFQTEAAYYFITGYWGNNLLVTGLRSEFDVIYYDEQSHYCLMEAIQLANCPAYAFQHRNAEDLARQLENTLQPGQRPLLLSDGVFASSGRIAPIDAYREKLRNIPGSIMIVDDAHAVAVLGNGSGTYSHFGIPFHEVNRYLHAADCPSQPRLYCCGTLSKAIGGSGGIIAGSRDFVTQIRNSSRYFNAASSPPSPVAGATAQALKMVMSDPTFRARQQENAYLLRSGLRELGFDIDLTPVPFTGLIIGDGEKMMHVQKSLRERGIIVAYAKSYAGVAAGGQLRIAISSGHTPAMIQRLLSEIASLI